MAELARAAWLVCAAGLVSTSARALAPEDLYRQLSPSVWQVGALSEAGKPFATGSAVVVAPQTLVTNCHVLKGAASIVIRQHNISHEARLQHADVERDLCQLVATGLQAPAVAVAPGAARVGQRVYTIGAPRGLELTLSDGLVSGLREEGVSGGLIQISAPISPGSSGGGLFDEEGRLLGITSSGVVGVAQNLNFARPAALIAEIPARATEALTRWRGAEVSRSERPTAPADPAALPAMRSPRVVAPPVATAPGATIDPPRRMASGYAALDDIDAIPYLGERGRREYQNWLKLPLPRAFALAADGHFWLTSSTRPRDPDLPVDPTERALLMCERTSKLACKLYAVNNAVVWVKEPSPLGRELLPPVPPAVPSPP